MRARTAWVTGASRGVGRGAAVSLGAAGWTVYVTARSSSAGGRTGHLPGTVDETAAAVSEAGGRGIGVVCDHRDDEAVTAVAERIGRERGSLDLLVNNAWSGYQRLNAGAWEEWTAPFWRQPAEHFDDMFSGGVRMHYMTLRACAPLLIAAPGSLVVTLSVGLTAGAAGQPGGVAYVMAKAADDALAAAAAAALAGHDVTSVALHPSWVRTEGVMQFAEHLDLSDSQSPEGVGRAIAALADDPERASLSGLACTVADLASRCGVDVSA
jgi:dehydrogenase/reductase SDR family member 1